MLGIYSILLYIIYTQESKTGQQKKFLPPSKSADNLFLIFILLYIVYAKLIETEYDI